MFLSLSNNNIIINMLSSFLITRLSIKCYHPYQITTLFVSMLSSLSNNQTGKLKRCFTDLSLWLNLSVSLSRDNLWLREPLRSLHSSRSNSDLSGVGRSQLDFMGGVKSSSSHAVRDGLSEIKDTASDNRKKWINSN